MTMLWSTSAATILLICARTCSAIGPLVEPLKHVVDKECLFQPPAGRTLCLGGSEEGGTSVWGDQKTGRCLAHGNCTSWIRIRASDAKEGYPGQRIDVDLFWKASLATSSIEYAQDMIEFYFSPYAYGSKRNGLVVGIFIRPFGATIGGSPDVGEEEEIAVIVYKYFVDGIPVERTVDGANNSFTFEKDGEPRQILGIYEFYHIHLVSETGIFYTTYTNLSVNFNINLSKDWIALYLTPLEGTEQKHVYQTELTGVLCLPSADSDFIHIVIIVVSVIAVLMLLALVFCVVRRRRKKGMRILNDISEMPDTIIAVHSDVVPVDKYPRTDLTEIPKSTIEGNVATASKSKSKASSSPRSRGINEVRSSSSASTGANKDATLLVSRSGSPVRKAHSGPKATRTPAQKSPSKAKTRSGVKTPSRAKTGSGARVRSPSGAKKVAKS